jgi:hypothetical protein
MDRIKYMEKIRNKKFDNNIIRILTSYFFQLDNDEKNICLDIKMDFVMDELQNEIEVYKLFDQLDSTERYSDMLRLIIMCPKIIGAHLEEMSQVLHYNIIHKWDWDLDKIRFVSEERWLYDLIYVYHSWHINYSLRYLIKTKILKKYNIDISSKNEIGEYIGSHFDQNSARY